MKYLLLSLLVIFTCCNQQTKPTEIEKPESKHLLEGSIDEIMEQYFRWKRVSYTFAYDANRISKEKYSISLPEDATPEMTVQAIRSITKAKIELENNTIILYE